MRTHRLFAIGRGRWLCALLAIASFAAPHAHGQYYLVDCSGTNWWAFPNINSALWYAWPGTTIVVTGTCNENVTISQKNNIRIGAYWGRTATLNGNLNVIDSDLIYLYGLSVSNQYGDGVDVSNSRVTFDSCSSSGNLFTGLLASGSSHVEITAAGRFNDNGASGLYVVGHSFLDMSPWAGPVEVRRNKQAGIWSSQGDVTTGGNTLISDTANGPAIDFRGAARGQFGNWAGANVIENNPSGGVSLQENAEISFWSLQSNPVSVIRNNSPYGIAAGFGSQVTLAGAQVSDNAGTGIDIYAHSQLCTNGLIPGLLGNQILRNGSAGDLMSAAIRVDGNSEALLRGGDISQSTGPGVLVLVNSSIDFAGVNFTGNAGGLVACDSSATMVSDLSGSQSTPASGVSCKSPHGPVTRPAPKIATTSSDVKGYKSLQEEYRKATSGTALNAPQ